jgi:hypothetical protein
MMSPVVVLQSRSVPGLCGVGCPAQDRHPKACQHCPATQGMSRSWTTTPTLSLRMIRQLHDGLRIPYESLLARTL